jgi:Fe-S oxidoreductase
VLDVCEENSEVDCTTCRLCVDKCPGGIELDKVLPVLRALVTPRGSHRGVFQTIGKLLANTNAEIQPWFKEGEIETDENSEIAYFPGCAAIYDILLNREESNYSGGIVAGVKVLNKLGIKPRIIYGCCGHDLYYGGHLEDFEHEKEKITPKITGKIITGCAECYHMLKNFYDADVVHFSDFILEQVKTGKLELKPVKDLKVTFHDPCRLGRHNEIYEPPRELLKMIGEVVEMEHNKKEGYCCSVSSWLNCNKESKKVREERLREAVNTEAKYLITACPKCNLHLDCYYCDPNYDDENQKRVQKIKLLDLQEIIGYAMGVYDPFNKEKSFEIKPVKTEKPPTAVKTGEFDLNKYLTPEVLDKTFSCTTCRLCTEVCPSGHDTSKKMEGFRAALVQRELGPEKHKKIVENLKQTGNVFGEERGVSDTADADSAEIIYFPGCVAKYRRDELKNATTEIFKALGIKYVIPEDIVCCGSVLFRTGHDPSELVKKNQEIFGDKPVVVSCAGCYSTFKHDYETVNVQHLTEFLSDKLDKLQLNELKGKVTYHDPCHLGRGSGLFDEPRKVISAIPGLDFVEFENCRTNSICCGAGGGVKSAKPELANELGRARAEQAKDMGVDVILSACPFCELNLKENSELKSYDVCELLLRAIKNEAL